MTECVLVMAETDKSAPCPVCGELALWGRGPRLVCADSGDAVCRDCAKVHAPQLIALVDLAQTADKVGRHSRHLLTPPMRSLLELARAAETFAVTK